MEIKDIVGSKNYSVAIMSHPEVHIACARSLGTKSIFNYNQLDTYLGYVFTAVSYH